MNYKKTYAVLGLGRYGLSVAKELERNGADVIAVDRDEKIINSNAKELSYCKCADIMNIDALKSLGIENVDTVIIAMADNFEASIMAIMFCKELGVKNIIVKCSKEIHEKIILKLGVTKVVFPEKESGVRLAKNILSAGFIDLVEVTKEISMIELDVKKEWIGKTLIELDLRRKYSINVIAIKENEEIDTNIDPTVKLNENMKLIVLAKTSKISKMI